jgi:hypothetical protein
MSRSSRDVLSELTVANLKEIARQIGQSLYGTKAELVARILSVGEDGWRDAFEHLASGNSTQDLLPDLDAYAPAQQMRQGEEVASHSGGIVATPDHLAVPPELLAREVSKGAMPILTQTIDF